MIGDAEGERPVQRNDLDVGKCSRATAVPAAAGRDFGLPTRRLERLLRAEIGVIPNARAAVPVA